VSTLFLTILACTTSELSESWQIDRTRVLAVAAEPAEPRPGDVVDLRALVVGPEEVGLVVWVACVTGDDDANGCVGDTSAFSEVFADGAVSPEEQATLQEAGLVGVEPFVPPRWTVPADALDGLPEERRAEGVSAFVNVSVIPGPLDMTGAGEPPDLDEADLELAYKRVPVSLTDTPNRNPRVEGVDVDGVRVEDGATAVLDRGETYTLTPLLASDAVEAYTYVREDGTVETRDEIPWIAFYATDGRFNQTESLYPELGRTWTAPETAGTHTVWFVARDRRGGMGWATLRVEVR
jgi:hypothetical protein